jgi:hypothetical protein
LDNGMSEARRLRFAALPNRFLPLGLQVALAWFAMLVVFVPGLWIVAGFLVVEHDVPGAIVMGAVWLGVAALIAVTFWHQAFEVIVDGDEVRWRGLLARGRAPLRELRRVKRAQVGRRMVAFEFTRLRGFDITPAWGLAEFLDQLRIVAPHILVELPDSVWRSARWHRGVFEETPSRTAK